MPDLIDRKKASPPDTESQLWRRSLESLGPLMWLQAFDMGAVSSTAKNTIEVPASYTGARLPA